MPTVHNVLKNPDLITVINDNGTLEKNFSQIGENFNGTKVIYQSQGENDILLIESVVPVKFLKLRWKTSFPKDSIYLADDWERGYGTLGFQKITPNRIMPWYFLMSTSNEKIGYGVMVQPNAMCFWQVDPSGLTLIIDVRNGGNGVELGNRRLPVCEIISRKYENVSSFEAAKNFCKAMCPNPIFPQQPVYGSNNWYYAYGDSSSENIINDAKYLSSLTYNNNNEPFMVIDDGWQQNHKIDNYNGGPWFKGNSRFPDMKGLANLISSYDVKPGIWVRLLQNESEEIPNSWRNPINNNLDPSNPEALEYIKEDLKRLCGWGYRLIKHDFSTFDLFNKWGFEMNPLVTEDGWNFYDHSLTSAEIVKKLYKAILKVANQYDALILGCNTIGHLGAGLMHLNRVGDDTSGKEWERTRQIGINSLAFRLPQDQAFFSIDADCVGITGHIDWYFNKQWAQLIEKSGTSLFISIKPNILNNQQKIELTQIMERASKQEQHFIPMDWEQIDCPQIWSDGKRTHKFDWFEQNGIKFNSRTSRYLSFLSIIP